MTHKIIIYVNDNEDIKDIIKAIKDSSNYYSVNTFSKDETVIFA